MIRDYLVPPSQTRSEKKNMTGSGYKKTGDCERCGSEDRQLVEDYMFDDEDAGFLRGLVCRDCKFEMTCIDHLETHGYVVCFADDMTPVNGDDEDTPTPVPAADKPS